MATIIEEEYRGYTIVLKVVTCYKVMAYENNEDSHTHWEMEELVESEAEAIHRGRQLVDEVLGEEDDCEPDPLEDQFVDSVGWEQLTGGE